MTIAIAKPILPLTATLPVVANRAGILLMLTADTLIVGWRAPEAFAGLGLAIAVQGLPVVVAIAYMQASLVRIARASGAGRTEEYPAIWRASLVHAAGLGLAGAALCLAGGAVLRVIGTAEPLVQEAERFLPAYAWGLPGLTLFLAASYRLDGAGRVLPGMIAILAANIFNLGAGLWVVDAAPESVAHFTSAARWAMALGLVLFVVVAGRRAEPREESRVRPRLGVLAAPIALTQLVETTAFTIVVPLAGLLGAAAAGAHHAALQVVQIAYMGTLGVAAATAIAVGRAAGGGDSPGAAHAARAGLALAIALAAPVALLLLVAPGWVAALFVRDEAVREAAIWPLRIAAGVVLLDAAMGVRLGALRGLKDVWMPFKLHILAFWVVAIPCAALAPRLAAADLAQPFWGILAGLTVSVLLLGRRLTQVLDRPAGPDTPGVAHPRARR